MVTFFNLIWNNKKKVGLDNVVKIERFSSLQRLTRVTGRVYRLYHDIKIKQKENRDVRSFLSAKESNNAKSQWIKVNQSSFARDKIETLKRELNLVIDENYIYRCEGRLRESPLLFEVKTRILISSSHRIAELIVTDLYIRLKHISIKQTLTELRQTFWICKGRSFF